MTESFLIFTPNPPSITTMSSSNKQTQRKKIISNIKNILEDYKINDLANQEMKLFNFIDEKLEGMNPSHLHKIIKKFIDEIKGEMKKNSIKPSPISFPIDRTEFNLTFSHILSMVNIIIYILENNTEKGKTSEMIQNFIYRDKIPSFKESKVNDQQISQVIKILNNVKTLHICLYSGTKDNYYNNRKKDKPIKTDAFYMDSKVVFFFSLFYKAFFRDVLSINFDLNIQPLDEYFCKNNNPYIITEEQVLFQGRMYKDIITCNLIMIKSLQKIKYLENLNFKMYDSYQLELHNTLTHIFEINNIKDNIDNFSRKTTMGKISGQKIKNIESIRNTIINKQRNNSAMIDDIPIMAYSNKYNNNYLYFQHLLNMNTNIFSNFTFDFNSLDPLLFSSVNDALIKFTCISKLNLIFFPHQKFNKRKTVLNNFFYNKWCPNKEQSDIYSIDDKKIYYQYLDNDNTEKDNTNNDNFILKDEKLLNELFCYFNKNLQNLSIILEQQVNELLSLSIDFSTDNNDSLSLYNYDNYNCSIICFIFDLFKAFQIQMEKCQIKSLDIFYDDFLDEKLYVVDTIKKKNASWKNGIKLNDLKLNHINFNISNISLILPFENFPSVNLTELILSNLSYNDLNNLINAFKKNKDIFPVLMKLDISLGVFVEDYKKQLEILLKESLPQKLKHFCIKLPFNTSIHELIDILYWIKINHNNEVQILLKIINEEMSKHINKDYLINIVIDNFIRNKSYLIKRNLVLDYKANADNNVITIEMNKYKEEELNNYYSIIYCLKKYNREIAKDEEKIIFKNIFNYKGNFRKYNVLVEFCG